MLERWMLVGIIVLWRQPASALSEKTEDSQRLRGTRKTEAALKRMRNKGSLKARARAGKRERETNRFLLMLALEKNVCFKSQKLGPFFFF